jgi:hypothetical protein
MMTARRLLCTAFALGFTLSLSGGIAAARQATPPAPAPGATPPAKSDAPKPAPKQDDLTNPITGSKPRPPARPENAPDPTPAAAPEPAKPAGEPAKDPKAADAATQTITAGGLTFDIPKEWVVETPAKSMFTPVAQFRIPAGKTGATEDATVKVFTGIRGGVGPNIERWKAQIGSQDKPSEEKDVKVGTLPVHVLYTGKGTFSAGAMMGGAGEAKKNYMIAGAIVVLDDGDVQFKATGPGVLIDAQKPAWEAMIKSMRVAK